MNHTDQMNVMHEALRFLATVIAAISHGERDAQWWMNHAKKRGEAWVSTFKDSSNSNPS